MPSPASPDFASIPVVRLRIDGSLWRLLVAALVGAGAAMGVMAWQAWTARSPERLRAELFVAYRASELQAQELVRMKTIDAREANLMLMRTLRLMAEARSTAASLVHGTDAQDLQEATEQLRAGEVAEQEFRRWDTLAQEALDQWRRAERVAGAAPAWSPAQIAARASSEPLRDRMQRHRVYARRALMRLIERRWRPTTRIHQAHHPGWPAPQPREAAAAALPPLDAFTPKVLFR